MQNRVAVLRKTLGPLSAGTPINVLGEAGKDRVKCRLYAGTIRALTYPRGVPPKKPTLRPPHDQLLGEFIVDSDMIVWRRPKTVQS